MKKNEEIKISKSLERTLNIFNNLAVKQQEEIENSIIIKNKLFYLKDIKKSSKIFYYRLISRFIEQELKNIKL